MYLPWILTISFCISTIFTVISGAESIRPEAEDRLLQDMLSKKYNKYVAPTHNGPVQVELHFSLLNVEFKDEAKELTSMHIWLETIWNDPRLFWNSTDYNGTDFMFYPLENMWLPDIGLLSSGSSNHHSQPNAWIDSSGGITLYNSFAIETVCRLNLRYFPYDKQTCTLSFGSWAYWSDVVQLTPYVYEFTHIYNQRANDFKMSKIEARDHEWEEFEWGWAHAEFSIHMERISSAYSVKLVLPAVVTGFLILMTFLLSPASQEKITLAGLIFISLILQLVNLQDLVPASGQTMVGDFLGFAICMDFFAILLAVLSYYVYSKSGNAAVKDSSESQGAGGESGISLPMPHCFQKVISVLRFLDIVCFCVFLIVYIIGLAAILGQRE